MASVQANGITIEYEIDGDGEPLLMVMGLSGQLIDWPPMLIQLLVARGFKVIRFDNRDSGLSTECSWRPPSRRQLAKAVLLRRPLATEYRLSDMADDAAGLLDALGIESAHVAGISMGGMIAQSMAIAHPNRVRSLASIMSTTGNPWVGRPTMRIMRDAVRRPIPPRHDAAGEAVELFRTVCGPHFDEVAFKAMADAAIARSYRPLGTARQTAAIIASPDRTQRLRQVQAPTVVVHGMLDPLVRVSGGIATAKAIRGSRLVLFNDMAHDLPAPRLTEIADEIAANCGRASAPAAAGRPAERPGESAPAETPPESVPEQSRPVTTGS